MRSSSRLLTFPPLALQSAPVVLPLPSSFPSLQLRLISPPRSEMEQTDHPRIALARIIVELVDRYPRETGIALMLIVGAMLLAAHPATMHRSS